ncbi:YbhN family protein, partial [Patescibacteria group bacterium]
LSLVILFIASILYYFLGNKERAKSRVIWLTQKIDKAEDNVSQEERVRVLLQEFYANFEWIKNNKIKLLVPAIVQFIKFLSDALTIFLIFLALGHVIPFGVAVVAFALGRLFGIVTLIPGGLGAFEGSTILILNSLGASLELAVAVTLIYRLFSYWAYMPLGLWYYKYFEKNDL